MFVIETENETFGTEVFNYETKEEMQAGLLRLVDRALEWFKKDGIVRAFAVGEEVICAACSTDDHDECKEVDCNCEWSFHEQIKREIAEDLDKL